VRGAESSDNQRGNEFSLAEAEGRLRDFGGFLRVSRAVPFDILEN